MLLPSASRSHALLHDHVSTLEMAMVYLDVVASSLFTAGSLCKGRLLDWLVCKK